MSRTLPNHSQSEEKVKGALDDFGLRKPRKDKTSHSRNPNPVNCAICRTARVIKYIHNHLREFHEIKGDISKIVKKCNPVIQTATTVDTESESSAYDSDTEDEQLHEKSCLEKLFTLETANENRPFFLESSDIRNIRRRLARITI